MPKLFTKRILFVIALVLLMIVVGGWGFYSNLVQTIPVTTGADFQKLPLYT